MSGYLKQRHGMTLVGNTPPGTCEMCAVKHDPAQPHNCQSLTYQYKFYDQNGRFPTWEDAMEHCTQEVKDYWTAALAERGDRGMSIYRYGMRSRGFSPMCQPMDGFVKREDDPTGNYHDILSYSRKLTKTETDGYELDYLGESSGDWRTA